MKLILPIFFMLFASACTTLPRTPADLRKGTSAMSLTKTEIHTINRKYSLVVRDIKKNTLKCLKFAWSQSSNYRGVSRSHGTKFFRPKVVTTGSRKTEMTMQWDRIPRANHDPKGGYYVFLADISKINSKKTRIKMYGSSFFTWNPIFNAVKRWGQGKKTKCPDSP